MWNFLLYEKNINNCKNIIKIISSIDDNTRISCISTSLSEINLLINKFKIDIIIIDALDNFNYSLLYSLVNTIHKIPIIILIKPTTLFIQNNVVKINSIDLLFSTIKTLLSKVSIFQLESIISKELECLCFNRSHLGTLYLIDVISILYYNYDLFSNLKKYVYPVIAKKYSVSINTLKCDIYHSINHSYVNCKITLLENYLEMSCIEKPAPKNYILSILKHIRIET